MLENPDYYLNRELSWLKFNLRVLREAQDKRNPLLERLKFIAITAANLDEFFMIRVAGLKQQLESGINKKDASGLTVEAQLTEIAQASRELVRRQYHYLKVLRQELEGHDIYFLPISELPEKCREWTELYFRNTIYPVITPLAIDSSHPFPFLGSRSLHLAVELQSARRETKTAVLQVPGVLPRIVEVPATTKKRRFVFLEDIIRTYCPVLFHGYAVKDILPFRLTRNADLAIDEEDAEDLLAEVEKSLRQRRRGHTVRLELGKGKSRTLRKFIIDGLKIDPADIYEIPGPLDASCFAKFSELPGYAALRYPPFSPAVPPELQQAPSIFAAIRQGDILLHHPYESFSPVVDFIRQAATDPQVLAIKQTLYRVGGNSPIVQALAAAAESGKQVTVLVELKARFDEENNIIWAKRLEEAGCHVIYGLVGLKTHAKIALVVRREEGIIRRYVHIGTGNYNEATARVYTDLGLFTANDLVGTDASAFFNVLSGYSDPPVWNKIVVAPLGLREKLYELIAQEASHARAGRPARMIAKLNSLVDKYLIEKLYEASQQGVKIDLIVRGICALRPGIPGISENITVRSIVGRFLEHTRIFYFSDGGDERVFLSSADWMPRNLNERVELLFPVEHPEHISRLKQLLELFLRDNQKASILKRDGHYKRIAQRGPAVNSQEELLRLAQDTARAGLLPIEQLLKPAYRRKE
ncbi:MAG TPA: RNA degradosome polyphosphate kinase [Selenomonadales bacterium]|nr:RNA degradosome polyphosphate kinase [Selenomonadales bacterium]